MDPDRRQGAGRLSEAVVKALAGIHALLTPEQREKLAYLIRTALWPSRRASAGFVDFLSGEA